MIRTKFPLRSRRRAGFTLVELMVSAAICVIIMFVLARAFQIGIDTTREMRSAGDMADQLRAATEVIRRDLQGGIFVSEEGKQNGGIKLSDQRFDLGVTQPIGGFMAISSSAVTSEGADPDGLLSTFANNHSLQFTSILSSSGEQNVFTAISPPGGKTFTSPAAELGYFLANPAPIAAGGPGGLPLSNLYRRQRLAARTDDEVLGLTTSPADTDVISWNPTGTNLNTLRALANNGNRLQNLSPITTAGRVGEDILLSNVLSFEVRANWVPQSGIASPRPFGTSLVPSGSMVVDNPTLFTQSTDYPFDTLAAPTIGNIFDSSVGSASKIRVLALMIRIRIYDPKLQSARQLTIVQYM